jgi:hypothetical protein
MIGKTVYVLKECGDWEQYCVQMTITQKQIVVFGRHRMTLYIGHRTGDQSYESSYREDDRLGRLVRTMPFPKVPAFDNEKDVWTFTREHTYNRFLQRVKERVA